MKRNIILLICLILLPLQVMTLTAQERKMNMADYEKRKKEFVEKEAGLSKAEADKYFPLTNELTKKEVRTAPYTQGESATHQGQQQHLGGGIQKTTGRRCGVEDERGSPR